MPHRSGTLYGCGSKPRTLVDLCKMDRLLYESYEGFQPPMVCTVRLWSTAIRHPHARTAHPTHLKLSTFLVEVSHLKTRGITPIFLKTDFLRWHPLFYGVLIVLKPPTNKTSLSCYVFSERWSYPSDKGSKASGGAAKSLMRTSGGRGLRLDEPLKVPQKLQEIQGLDHLNIVCM